MSFSDSFACWGTAKYSQMPCFAVFGHQDPFDMVDVKLGQQSHFAPQKRHRFRVKAPMWQMAPVSRVYFETSGARSIVPTPSSVRPPTRKRVSVVKERTNEHKHFGRFWSLVRTKSALRKRAIVLAMLKVWVWGPLFQTTVSSTLAFQHGRVFG